jgi:hypothetical protein
LAYTRRALRGMLVIVAVIAATGAACRFLYFGERAVTLAIGSIPGAKVRAVWGEPELIPSWFYAKIDVQGGPSLFLFNLTRQSFEGPGGFCFFQVGSHAVRYASEGGINNSLCFNDSGEVAGLGRIFPVKIGGVRDFIEHAGEIERALAEWPRCPAYKELTGTTIRYRVCTNADVSIQLYPNAL